MNFPLNIYRIHRPTARIPDISFEEFSSQVDYLAAHNISFNYLLNTPQRIGTKDATRLLLYVEQLLTIGINRITLGTPEQIQVVRKRFSDLHLILSITFGAKSLTHISMAADSGANAVYLDGTAVNRDFRLLKRLVSASDIGCRLYANMSCISACPVVKQHYRLFADRQSQKTAQMNDAYFAGCSLVKLRNPVEWIQMPWIRPEDIWVYVRHGVFRFKLADRLAPTPALLQIARCYLSGKSPDNLFVLMERDGVKYRLVTNGGVPCQIRVESIRIPDGFVQHFADGDCDSTDTSCSFCTEVAGVAVSSEQSSDYKIPKSLIRFVPRQLLDRAAICE